MPVSLHRFYEMGVYIWAENLDIRNEPNYNGD